MDFISSYNRFTREVKERFICFKKHISKDVAEWKGKFTPSVQADDKLQKLIGTIEICNEINNRIESKFLAFERRIIELENEKHQMKVDIKNLQHEKCQLLNKLSNFDEIEQSNKKLEKNLDREISEKTGLKLIVEERLQNISRLEKRLKNEKNSHSVIQSANISLEKKIERLQKQHYELKKANEENTANWKIRLEESETKLQKEKYKNTQLSDKLLLLEKNNRKTSEDAQKLRTSLQGTESALKQERMKCNEVNTQLEALIKRNHELEVKNQTAEKQLELLENQYQSLQDELTAKEKEKLSVLNSNKCLMEETLKTKTVVAGLEKKLEDYEELRMKNDYFSTLIKQLESEMNALKNEKIEIIASANNKEIEIGTLRAKLNQNGMIINEIDNKESFKSETMKNNERKKSNLNSRQESFIKIRW